MSIFNDAAGVITSLPLRIPFEKSPHFSFNYSRRNGVNNLIYTQLPSLSTKAPEDTTTVTGVASPSIPLPLGTHDPCAPSYVPLFPLPLVFVDILLPLTSAHRKALCDASSALKETFRLAVIESFLCARKDAENVLVRVLLGPYHVVTSSSASHDDGDSCTTFGGNMSSSSAAVVSPTNGNTPWDSTGVIPPYTISSRQGSMSREPIVLIEWFEALDTLCNYSGTAFVELRETNDTSIQCPPLMYGSVEEAKIDQENAKIIVEMATMQSQLTDICRSYFCRNQNDTGIKCLSVVIQVLDNFVSDPFVVAAGLFFLYNLLHPASINVTRNRCYASTPCIGDGCSKEPLTSDPSEEKSFPLFLNEEDLLGCDDLNVRSEIRLMNKNICPVRGKSLTSPTQGRSYTSLYIQGCVVNCVRDAKLVKRLEKCNLSRTLFSVICKHTITAEALDTQMTPETMASMKCVYLANMLLSSIGGATKQREEDWILSRISLSRTIDGRDILDNTSSRNYDIDAADGDDVDEDSDGMESMSDQEENDNDLDDTTVSSGKETAARPSCKETVNVVGGATTGPLRACWRAEKMGMLARLSGAMSAMITLLRALVLHVAPTVGETSSDPIVSYSRINNLTIANTGEYYKWNTMMCYSNKRQNNGQEKLYVTFDGHIAALLACLATICVGEPNVSSALKRGLLTLVTGMLPSRLRTCVTMKQQHIIEQSAPYFTHIRWGYELVFKLCCPIESGINSNISFPSMQIGLSNLDTTMHFRDGFVKAKGISVLLGTMALSLCCRPASAQGSYGTIPFLSFSLFAVCSDLLYILISNIPAAQQQFKSTNGISIITNALANAALIDGSANKKDKVRNLPLPLSCWILVLRCFFKLFDVKDIPVGNDNDLVWVPPPELIEKLKKQNNKEPNDELPVSDKADTITDEKEECETEESSENGKDSDEEDEEDDIIGSGDYINSTEGLEYFSPELKYAANLQTTNPLIPPKTSIMGVTRLNHVKPFSEPRPTPSSPKVIENYPKGEPFVCPTINNGRPIPLSVIEPLLVQTERQKIMVIKFQLLRFIFPKSVIQEIVYDDMDRNRILPKTKYGSNYALDIPSFATVIDCDIPLSFQPNIDPPPETPVEYCKEIRLGNQLIHKAFLPTELSLSDTGAVKCTPEDFQHYTNHQQPPLRFASNFECGNLKRAIRVMDDEYDLILHSDINTTGFIQWFYFRVEGMVPGVPYRFNIINMEKTSSTFNDGQRPLLFSDRRFIDTKEAIGWTREGYSICYYRNNFKRKARQKKTVSSIFKPNEEAGNERVNNGKETEEGNKPNNISVKKAVKKSSSQTSSSTSTHSNVKQSINKKKVTVGYHYTLSFTIVFPSYEDKCYICNCYPYSYSDLIGYLRTIDSTEKGPIPTLNNSRKLPQSSVFIQNFCPSLCGNVTPIVTITNCTTTVSSSTPVNSSIVANRPVVILTARVHPGESNASYMMKGAMDFLLDSQNPAAEFLRNSFVFKIIPMLNPDGVINGNHRCSLSGKDLNREYGKPGRWTNPIIFNLKAFVRHMKEIEGRTILLYADFHGHSRCQNFVIYGCGDNNTTGSLLTGLIHQAAAKVTSIGKPISSSASTSQANPPSNLINGKSKTPLEKKLKKRSSTPLHPFLEPHPGVVPEKVFPLILHQLTPFFALKSSTFKIEKAKRNTGRVVFYRELGIRLSYTVEASMMGGIGCDFCLSSFDGRCQDSPPPNEEELLRAAAKWSIFRKQSSGINPSNNIHRTMNGHYNGQHYVTFGVMFLKALGEMWKVHNNQKPITIQNTQQSDIREAFALPSISKSLGCLIQDTEAAKAAAALKTKKTLIKRKKDVSNSKKLVSKNPTTKIPSKPVVNGLKKVAPNLNTAPVPLGQITQISSSVRTSCKSNTLNDLDCFENNNFSVTNANASRKMPQLSIRLTIDSGYSMDEEVVGMNMEEDEGNEEEIYNLGKLLIEDDKSQIGPFSAAGKQLENTTLPPASRIASSSEVCTILKAAFKQGPVLTRKKRL